MVRGNYSVRDVAGGPNAPVKRLGQVNWAKYISVGSK